MAIFANTHMKTCHHARVNSLLVPIKRGCGGLLHSSPRVSSGSFCMWNTRHPLAFARQPHHHPRSLAPTGARARERGQAHMSESRPACTAGTTIRHRSLKPIAVSATPFTDGRLDQRNWVRGMDSIDKGADHLRVES